jgi:hypothetical protein
VDAHAYHVRLHFPRADDEQGVDFRFFGVLDFAVEPVRRVIGFHAEEVGTEFIDEGLQFT